MRRHTDNGEVRSAAANVDDEGELFGADLALVVEGSGDGLELEFDVLEACLSRRLPELILCTFVGLRVLIHEKHGAAHDDGRRLVGGLAHVAEEQRDDLVEPKALCSNLRLLVDERGSEHRFQRAHQASILALQVPGDGIAAEGDACVLEAEEYCGGN